MTKVRVRFAPSPTGFQHVGGMRSALFNYLFARQNDGVFIVRLEDTDRERFVEGAEEHLFKSLAWLGIMPDESTLTGGDYGPYTQSQRLEHYETYAAQLSAKGALYPCWCSPERLSELREQAQKEKRAFKYDRHCLDNPGDLSKAHVLRFRIPDKQPTISWDDLVFGPISFEAADLDDFVCIKSDGFPTYHFANIVDDHLMEISHVLRAAEWLPSTPKHLLLWQAFGWPAPAYAHLPQILGPDGKRKLGKRDGAKDVLEYAQEGYLSDAVVNFMALLGWNAGDGSTKEIYTRDELIKAFSLAHVQKSPAVFDPERLIWLNGVYIRSLPIETLLELSADYWPLEAKGSDDAYKKRILGLIQERLKFLAEIPELTDFFFIDPPANAIKQITKINSSDVGKYLDQAEAVLAPTTFEHDGLETALRKLAEDLNVKPGDLFSVLRIAITGKTAAPGLFETMVVLGKEVVLKRIRTSQSIF